jgi:hypothetical protein
VLVLHRTRRLLHRLASAARSDACIMAAPWLTTGLKTLTSLPLALPNLGPKGIICVRDSPSS